MASTIDRFRAKYKIDEDSGCWNWTGATNSNGRAAFSIGGNFVLAHRYSYETFVKHITKNEDIRRSCNNPICVNPDHMYIHYRDEESRLWSCVDISEEDGHWYWNGPRLFKSNGKTSAPRRAVYADYLEKDPPKTLKPVCGESECINPMHCGGLNDSFWSRVDKNTDGHWYWTGSVLQSGYAHVSYNGSNQYVHRIAWDLTNKTKPKSNEVIYHLCRIKSCVNPDHLAIMTHGAIGEVKRLNNELSKKSQET